MKFPRPSPTLRFEAREFLKLIAIMLPMYAVLVGIAFLLQHHPYILAALGIVAVLAFVLWAAFFPVKEDL